MQIFLTNFTCLVISAWGAEDWTADEWQGSVSSHLTLIVELRLLTFACRKLLVAEWLKQASQ